MKARIFGEKNNNWKGDAVGYNQLHAYMRLRIPRPLLCECGLKAPHDLANKGIYNRDIHNWEWLCRKCHLTKDGRLGKLLKYARSSKTTGFALVNKNKTHCLRGHPFCGYNLIKSKYGRACRICSLANSRKNYHLRKEKRNGIIKSRKRV